MWNLLKKNDHEECGRSRNSLEEVAVKNADAGSIEGLIQSLPESEREHITSCQSCHEAAQDILSVREIFRGIATSGAEARPGFAARVMSAIAAREREVALRISAWAEFPRLASRLTWITAVVLLASTAWFYEKVVRTPGYPSNGATPESIFEAPPQASQDDLLISMSESNP